MKLISILVIFSLLSLSVFGGELHISSANDFIDFSNNVNSGVSKYSGTTVYLDTDIDFSGKSLDVIGKDATNYFLGTFDGQGHIISNLKINSNSYYAGLFGYSSGLTIKNVVFDDTCSVINYGSGIAYVGGILGKCESTSGNCNIENIVNMGDVTFNGDVDNLFIGGIAGYLDSSSSSGYNCVVKNCANYGSIVHSGTCSLWAEMGGIAGFSRGYSSSNYNYIQNCLNYGAITHSGTSKYRVIGGIVGLSYSYTHIDNCVSAGKISMTGTSTSYIGSITGYIKGDGIHINYCFWTSDTGYNKANGNGSPTIDAVTSQATLGSTTLNKLNTYSSTNGLSNWVMLHLNGAKLNDINQECLVVNNKYFPDPEKEGHIFAGWFKDSAFTDKYDPKSGGAVTDVYAKFTNNFIITFDFNNGTTMNTTYIYGDSVIFPTNPQNGDCLILYWKDETGDRVSTAFTVPARNVTLTAVWVCTRIASVGDFIDFANKVNLGTSYSGITVYLDTDIDFSGKSLDVIGNTNTKYFQGTFDGQGHIISNLEINSNSYYVGLFGYSSGLTIKNVAFDDTCSVINYGSGIAYVGGILGKCESTSGNCNIENIVNMGDVTFNGDVDNLFIGSIAGYLDSSSSGYNCVVKNCANYGSVVHSGTCSLWTEMGGIVGFSRGYSSNHNYIQNCLNYGAITHSGTSKNNRVIGGIVGLSNSYTHIENCVSAGKISMTGTSTSYIGSITGYIKGDGIHINYCFWTSDTGYNKANGTGSPTIDAVTSQATLGSTTLNKLNTYSSTNGLNNWVMLHLNGGKITNINQDSLIINNNYLPDPKKEGHTFAGWFKDSAFTDKYDPKSGGAVTDVYAKFGILCKVTFDFNNGTTIKIKGFFNEDVVFPENTDRDGYTFKGWFTDSTCLTPFDSSVITGDITLYAKYEEITRIIESSSSSSNYKHNYRSEESKTKESSSSSSINEKGDSNSNSNSWSNSNSNGSNGKKVSSESSEKKESSHSKESETNGSQGSSAYSFSSVITPLTIITFILLSI